jgi:cystathionine beta-lyase/cystathionine gamma-synthase
MVARFRGETTDPVYSRGDNPTVCEFERKVAALEGAARARAFSSGMGAIAGAVLSLVGAGERMLCVRHVYPDAYRLFRKLLPRLGVTVEYVDGTDAEAIASRLARARLLYLESPTSWVFETQELPRLAALAKAQGVTTIIDNSWATPLHQRPLACGIDLVLHSASKYLGGHSDTVAGVVCGSEELVGRINELTYPVLGAKLSPFEGWLLVRGLRTLPLRMARHHESALTLARRLAAHAAVERVFHPALADSPGKATLTGHSGLFSFALKPDLDVPSFCDALRLFRLGVSWGGHESLCVPAVACLDQAGGANSLFDFGVSPRVVRLSVGLEEVEDLWRDLEGAFAAARR